MRYIQYFRLVSCALNIFQWWLLGMCDIFSDFTSRTVFVMLFLFIMICVRLLANTISGRVYILNIDIEAHYIQSKTIIFLILYASCAWWHVFTCSVRVYEKDGKRVHVEPRAAWPPASGECTQSTYRICAHCDHTWPHQLNSLKHIQLLLTLESHIAVHQAFSRS